MRNTEMASRSGGKGAVLGGETVRDEQIRQVVNILRRGIRQAGYRSAQSPTRDSPPPQGGSSGDKLNDGKAVNYGCTSPAPDRPQASSRREARDGGQCAQTRTLQTLKPPKRTVGPSNLPTNIRPWQPSPGEHTMYEGADMPTADLPEDHVAAEPQPIPPDVSKLATIPGYANVGYYNNACGPAISPPSNRIKPIQCMRQEEHYSSVPEINVEQAREALIDFVTDKCCYGKKAAFYMQIDKITPSSALHYTLETFTETRSTSWEQAPYKGQVIDSPSNGTAPTPWSIQCQASTPFHNEVKNIEVPHTATVMACHGCRAQGCLKCYNCFGRGYKRCILCHGSGRDWKTDAHGHRHVESCWQCRGTGRKRCISCNGDGRVTCKTCDGYRKLKFYIKLTVAFRNNCSEHVIERSSMPDDLAVSGDGEVIFTSTQSRVVPIGGHPDAEVCLASQKLVKDHQYKFRPSKILMQRQQLRAVPISECSYTWRNDQGHFWVYGNECSVYVPDYPQKWCWGCILL